MSSAMLGEQLPCPRGILRLGSRHSPKAEDAWRGNLHSSIRGVLSTWLRGPEAAPNTRATGNHQDGEPHFLLSCLSPDLSVRGGVQEPYWALMPHGPLWGAATQGLFQSGPEDLCRAPRGAPALPLCGALLTQGLLGGLEVTLPPSCSFWGWFGAGF